MALSTNTSADFNAVLKRFTPYKMQVEALKAKNYFWNKVAKNEGWEAGTMEIPIEGAEASSLRFGKLVASNDISSGAYDMALVTLQPELWGAMKFYEKDLERHASLEQSYLSIIPGKLNQFTSRMSERVSMSLLGDGSIASLTANGANDGLLVVDYPQHFTIGEKIIVDDSDDSPITAYVRSINMGTKTLTCYDARTGGSLVNFTGYDTADSAKVYLPDAQANGFKSVPSFLLSAANGGSDAYFDKTKLDYPILQAQQYSGSAWTQANILTSIFDVFYDTILLGKGDVSEMLVPFHVFKAVAAKLEGSRAYVTADKSAGYGWRSLTVLGPEGEMKITAIRDMPTTKAYMLDWSTWKFHGDKFFERKRQMGGLEYFTERGEDGYVYITDTRFYGQLVCSLPSHNGAVYAIPSVLPAS